MPLSLEQVQIQTQKLVMTPQMQLSIKLLQMNTQEMEQLARQEILENPFLELEEEEEGQDGEVESPSGLDAEEREPAMPADVADSSESAVGAAAGETADAVSLDLAKDDPALLDSDATVPPPPPLDSEEGAETFDQVDVEWDDYYDEPTVSYASVREEPDEERDFTEYTASRRSLYDHLMWQLRVSALDGRRLQIGEFLIGNIDDNGYLTLSVEEAAAQLNVPAGEVEEVLRIIQTFDPTGVGARNLAECLLIQLDSQGLKDPIYRAILTEHFEQLGQQKFREVARALNVPEEKVAEVFRNIRRCEPKPGRSITKDTPSYVEPDVVVKKVDNRYLYFLNEGDLRHLHINDYYRHLLFTRDGLKDKEREYYRNKYRDAVWLIRNIERRKGTILRVTEAIMEYQKEFLEKGTEHLKPLTLRQIAEAVGMHESTIARVTANKYVETPRGVFPLKYFFSSSLDRDGSTAASSRSVKELIRKMVAEEDPKHPLSDSDIAKRLQAQGYAIARRTVAKYRDSLKILPANLRRSAARR
ncbi:MAG: RNA polymerase factor sigma-54 [Candidatus Sumerlaeia bacterium]|nr:RNA polymerase factor sigma-54 [Candidatus Sumerlaeia bacterium]